MPDPLLTGNACLSCQGVGAIDGDFCYSCIGTGYRISVAENIFRKKMYDDVIAKLDAIIAEQELQRADLTEALVSIIAEQASQRADLTEILTAIWNKVQTL